MADDTPDMTERYEQFGLEKPRIDREAGILHGVRVMGIKSAHGYEYSLAAQKDALGRYEQMPLGLDHDYSGAPLTVADAWGVLCNPRMDDRGTLADVKYLKTHVRTEQVLEDAERDVGLFSLSAVTTRCIERPKGQVVSFTPVRVDLVVRGATTKKLFEQANAAATAAAADNAALKAEVAALREKMAEIEARATKFEQYVQPAKALETTIAKTVENIDLKKFWND